MFKHISIVLSIILVFWSCNEPKKKAVDLTLLHATPYNTHFIIQINDKATFIKSLSEKTAQLVFNKSLSSRIPKAILANNRISKNNKLLLASARLGNELDLLLISKVDSNSPALDTVALHIEKVTDYNQIAIKKTTQFEEAYFFAQYKSLLLGSHSRLLIENAIRQLDEKINILSDSIFVQAYKTIDTANFANILVNNSKSDLVQLNPFSFDNTTYSNDAFCSWTALDVVKNKSQTVLNGISLSSDKRKFLETLAGNSAKKHQILRYIPNTVSKYRGIAISDFKQFKRNLDLVNDSKHNTLIDSIFPVLGEVAVFQLEERKILALSSVDTSKMQSFLLAESDVSQNIIYRNETIFSLTNDTLFNDFLSPFIQLNATKYYYQKDNVFYFSNALKTLKAIISSHQNNTLLLKNEAVQKLFQSLDDEGALLLFTKTSDKKLRIIINQYNYSDAIAYVNILLQEGIKINNTLSQKSIAVSNKSNYKPQFFTNFRKGQKQILLSDKNKISLVDRKGKVLWKKEIDGQVLGDIKEIDIYKNKKKQLLFTTKKGVYCLDINGNSVSGFPIKTRGIIQGVALFDYDNNKTYRIAVCKGKSIELYNAKGKKLNGFSYKGKSKIMSVPQHFRSFNKDYIVFASKDEKLHIINRRGLTRTVVHDKFDFSDNPLYFHDRFVVFTTSKGEEIQVNVASGKVARKALGLSKKHFMYTDKKVFISFDKNELKINSHTVSLPLGTYDKPLVLKNKKQTVVLLFNKEDNKIYGYNSNGKLLNGFPVYANDFMQATVDKGQFIILTQEDENNLMIYSF